MNSSAPITYQLIESVAILQLNHPPRNALTPAMMEGLARLLEQSLFDQARCVLIQGQPKAFCSGFEASFFKELPPETNFQELIQNGQQLFNQIEQFPVPVIAIIEGLCWGGGIELALACHLRFCQENTSFCFPELSLGILPALGGNQRLPKAVGLGKATELVLSGRLFGSQEALSIGLVQGCYEAAALHAKALRLAQQIETYPVEAVSACLRSLRAQETLTQHDALRHDAQTTALFLAKKLYGSQ